MESRTLVCSGYSAAEGEDLLLVRLWEDGRTEVISGERCGGNPSFCVKHGAFLYVVCELEGEASIAAWRITEDRLENTGKKISVPGGLLCHLYAGERALFGSSYESGDFCAVDYELEQVLWHRAPQSMTEEKKEDGSSTGAEEETALPHAHWMTEWQGQLLCADLGRDRIYRYRMQEGLPGEELPAMRLPKGAGPRQPLPVGDDGWLLSVQEQDSTLCLWKVEKGEPVCVQGVRTTVSDVENYPGTICMADENTVLVCNRGSNTVAAFSCGEVQEGERSENHPSGTADRRLYYLGEWETGNWPRYLMKIPDRNLFVNACNKEGKLVVFSWENGKLQKKSEIVLHGASGCTCVDMP